MVIGEMVPKHGLKNESDLNFSKNSSKFSPLMVSRAASLTGLFVRDVMNTIQTKTANFSLFIYFFASLNAIAE